MMSTKRRTISPEFKAKVALKAIRGVQTVNEIAVKYQILPNQVTIWKKQATENIASLFADGRAKIKKDESANQCRLLDLLRSTYNNVPWGWNDEALKATREIDEEYTLHPFCGKRGMCEYLQGRGYPIGVKCDFRSKSEAFSEGGIILIDRCNG